ncbi:MAG: hypothetical protein IH598_14170 [Bacteroidales bacterium]|nr:hypothetical protein [Bacteroidales bacterium]
MKKIAFRTAALMILMMGFILATPTFAQDPPPPPPGGHGGTGNQPPGGGTPIGSGLVILLSLGAAYGGKQVYEMRKRE